jgi:plastocyanin
MALLVALALVGCSSGGTRHTASATTAAPAPASTTTASTTRATPGGPITLVARSIHWNTTPAAGSYEFHCRYHPQAMRGTITVS